MTKPTFQDTIERLTLKLSEKITFINNQRELAVKSGRTDEDIENLDTLFDVGVFYAHTLLAIAKGKASGELEKTQIPEIVDAFNTIGEYITIVENLQTEGEL